MIDILHLLLVISQHNHYVSVGLAFLVLHVIKALTPYTGNITHSDKCKRVDTLDHTEDKQTLPAVYDTDNDTAFAASIETLAVQYRNTHSIAYQCLGNLVWIS